MSFIYSRTRYLPDGTKQDEGRFGPFDTKKAAQKAMDREKQELIAQIRAAGLVPIPYGDDESEQIILYEVENGKDLLPPEERPATIWNVLSIGEVYRDGNI